MTPEKVDEVLRDAVQADQASLGPGQLRGLDLGSLPYPRHAVALRNLARLRPVLAAAAVVLVVVLPLLFGGVPRGHQGPSHPPTGRPSQPVPDHSGTVPAWYAATTATTLSSGKKAVPLDITVRKTFSGAVLATVRVPAPYGTFAFVTSTGRPGVWVAGAQRWHPARQSAQPVRLFLLRYDGATARVAAAPLPIPELPGSQLRGVAMPADETRLAVVLGLGAGSGADVRVYTLPGGNVRTWTVPPQAGNFPPMPPYRLTWLDDGRTFAMGVLIFGPAFGVGDVTYLDTSAAAGSPAASRLVTMALPSASSVNAGGFFCTNVPVPASDGKTVTCAGSIEADAGGPGERTLSTGFGVFSATTGKLIRVRDQMGLGGRVVAPFNPDVLWGNATGGYLVVTGAARRSPRAVMLLAPDGSLRALPWSSAIVGSVLWWDMPHVAW